MKTSGWIMVVGAAVITIEGGDPDKVSDRLALIEKTPRVRIRDAHFREDRFTYDDGTSGVEYRWHEFLDWCEGLKGDGPNDPESRTWCEQMLTTLGYTLPTKM